MRGVNRGMQTCRSMPFLAKSVDLPIFLFKSETTDTTGKVNVNAIVTSNFAQEDNKRKKHKEGNMLDDYNTV